jgi:hypothetical protein
VLLHRSPERSWTALEASQAVYTVPTSAAARLDALVSAKLVASDGAPEPSYRFAPGSDQLARRVDDLAAAYARDRVALLKRVIARATDPAQQFADAFRLRRDKP